MSMLLIVFQRIIQKIKMTNCSKYVVIEAAKENDITNRTKASSIN